MLTLNSKALKIGNKWLNPINGSGPGPGPAPVIPIPGTEYLLAYDYNTVQIGNRIWTCNNIAAGGLAANEAVGLNLANTFGDWANAAKPPDTNRSPMGYYYTAIDKLNTTILTDGWRVPTEEDWLDLFSKTDQEGLRNTRSDNWTLGAGTNYWYFNTDGYCGGQGTNSFSNWRTGKIVCPDGTISSDYIQKVKLFWTSTVADGVYKVAYITNDTSFNDGSLMGTYHVSSGNTTNTLWLSIRLVKDAT